MPEDELDVAAEDLENEFETLMGELLLDEQHARAQLSLDEDLQRRLVELHKRAEEVHNDVARRHRLEAKLHAFLETNPGDAHGVLDEYKRLSMSLQSRIHQLQQDLNEHILPEVGAVSEHTHMSDEQVNHLRQIAMTIKHSLDSATAHITDAPEDHYEKLEHRVHQSAADEQGNLRPLYHG